MKRDQTHAGVLFWPRWPDGAIRSEAGLLAAAFGPHDRLIVAAEPALRDRLETLGRAPDVFIDPCSQRSSRVRAQLRDVCESMAPDGVRAIDAASCAALERLGMRAVGNGTGVDAPPPDQAPAETPESRGFPKGITIAPLADDPTTIDARRAVFLAGVLELLGQRTELILPDCARRTDEARRYLRQTGLTLELTIVPAPLIAAYERIDVVFESGSAGGRRVDPGAIAWLSWWASRHGAAVCRSMPPSGRDGQALLPDIMWWAGDLPESLRSRPPERRADTVPA